MIYLPLLLGQNFPCMKYTSGDIKGTKQKASNHMQHHRDIHFESQILELVLHGCKAP